MKQVGVIGAGAWGTALSAALVRAGLDVTIWAREAEVVDSINNENINHLYLDGATLPKALKAENDISKMQNKDILFFVTPAQFLSATCRELSSFSGDVIICSKGIERNSLRLMSDIANEYFPNSNILALSGPSFAIEVANNLPTSVTLAGKGADNLVELISSDNFKAIPHDDVIGAELAGAIKNIVAVACGISEGKELGSNFKASIITQGLNEIAIFTKAMGGSDDSINQLCGVGDLVLTCNSHNSRNMSFGYALGQGNTIDEIKSKRRTVAEGIESASSVYMLGKKIGVKTPICEAIHKLVAGEIDINNAVEMLIAGC